jgi:peptidoglycan/xylan/chitin deacetylase (PgdA/CDA1 family)
MRLVRAGIMAVLAAFLMLPMVTADAQQTGPFRVYLTFEDGPTEWYTPGILDILAQYNAKATFFVNGYQIEGREWVLQRVLREGHAIGNHLWVEPGHYAGADDEVIRESYLRTEQAIRAALGMPCRFMRRRRNFIARQGWCNLSTDRRLSDFL